MIPLPPDISSGANTWLHEVGNAFLLWITMTFMQSTKPPPDPLLNYYYGATLSVVDFVTIVLSAVIIPFALIFFKGKKALEAGRISLLIIGLGPSFFWACDVVNDFSDNIANAVIWYEPPTGNLLSPPSDIGIPAQVVSLIFMLLFGLLLGAVFVGCFVTSQLTRFVGMFGIALRPLGKTAKHWSDWIVSIGIVSIVTGRPTGAFVTSSCRWVGDLALKYSPGLAAWIITIAPLLAAIAVVGMFFVTHVIVTTVANNIRSWVHGAVQTNPKDRQKIDIGRINSSHARTMGAMPVHVTNPQSAMSNSAKQLLQGTRRHVGRALMVKAAASTNPAVAVGVTVITKTKEVKAKIDKFKTS